MFPPAQPEPLTPVGETLQPVGTVAKPTTPESEAAKKLNNQFRGNIQACKNHRKQLIPLWKTSIDYRRGKALATESDEDRIVVNLDWSLTKSKQASLFSQIPQVHVNHPPQTQQAGPWLQTFEQKLNDTLVLAGVESATDESLPDCINAAGVGVVICAHEAISEDVEVPSIDTSTLDPQAAASAPTTTVPRVLEHRYTIQRISPSDFLWPINFTGSDFDNAPWLGRSGRVTWTEAVNLFGLTESDKERVVGEDRSTLDTLTNDHDKDHVQEEELVGFDEIFYKEYKYNKEAKSYSSIHHLVFVTGKETPVVDEPWKGQRFIGEPGQPQVLVGASKFPVRALTLTYLTDETIPPSDSAIGRSQVNELNKLRTLMILQRQRNIPVRWYNVNGIDPIISQHLMMGTWQGMIPVQGDGSRLMGEIARSSMPQDDYQLAQIVKDDVAEEWQVGPNQQGNFAEGRQSATEANVVQSNFTTRIGRERAKVAKFFVSMAEVIGGLLSIYEPPETFGEGFDPAISKTLAYSILADSTVLIDSNQRRENLIKFLDFGAKTGFVDLEPVMREIAQLSGLDPNVVIKKPEPQPPVQPNISLRLTGTEDMMNPLTLAMILAAGQGPNPDLIEQAKQLIAAAMQPPVPPQPQGGPMGGAMPPQQGPVPPPLPPPPAPGDAYPEAALLDKIGKRSDEGQVQ